MVKGMMIRRSAGMAPLIVMALGLLPAVFSWTLKDGMPDHPLTIVNEVKSKSTPEEIEVLRTLLLKRASWHPRAETLLSDVLSRPKSKARRMQSETDCYGLDNVTCAGNLVPDASVCGQTCTWGSSWMGSMECGNPACNHFTDASACCANEAGVGDGCYWNADLGTCDEMLCNKLTDDDCARHSGCKMTCNGCQASDVSCECDPDSWDTCNSMGGGGGLDLLACPVMDCAMCMKSYESMPDKKSAASGACSTQCKGVVDCDEEVACLFPDAPSCEAALPSCVANIAEPAPSAETCDDLCAPVKACSSCGDIRCGAGEVDTGALIGLMLAANAPWMLYEFAAICAFCYASSQRTKMLADARSGKKVEPPSGCWKYCFGAAAIYYWEGCGGNYFIACALCPCFASCCWNPTAQPMENGQMVGTPVATGYVIGNAVS